MEERIRENIPRTLREGVVFSLYPKKEAHRVKASENKTLKEIVHIKTQGNERVVDVQRQHPVVLLGTVMMILLLFATSFLLIITLAFQAYIPIPFIIIFEFLLLIGSFSLVIFINSYMSWYFQFYAITTKSLFHRRFFRIGGYYSEEVFLETSPERNILRSSSNLFYSLLNKDDIKVLFQRPGLEEFVFKTPENPQRIEDCLEEIALSERKKI